MCRFPPRPGRRTAPRFPLGAAADGFGSASRQAMARSPSMRPPWRSPAPEASLPPRQSRSLSAVRRSPRSRPALASPAIPSRSPFPSRLSSMSRSTSTARWRRATSTRSLTAMLLREASPACRRLRAEPRSCERPPWTPSTWKDRGRRQSSQSGTASRRATSAATGGTTSMRTTTTGTRGRPSRRA